VPDVVSLARFRRRKAAVKMHALLDLRSNIPAFVHITEGKLHDVNVLDQIVPEAGAFYVMDRGYIDSSLVRVVPPQCSTSVRSPRGCNHLCFSLCIGTTGSCSSA
jgi:hypothetical protein